ncbi:hypothetical protein SAMN05892883_2204 [Jatrophihabitans sp. GAS493]|nr:hypothetical protein SAMN05892883_2204 [Jatrophihabitans sp. GAS493]
MMAWYDESSEHLFRARLPERCSECGRSIDIAEWGLLLIATNEVECIACATSCSEFLPWAA